MDRTADDQPALTEVMTLTIMVSVADMASAEEVTCDRRRERGRSEDKSGCKNRQG
jgi:hypothetical protein